MLQDDEDNMTDLLAEEQYGKKMRYTPPQKNKATHTHFDKTALSQALTPAPPKALTPVVSKESSVDSTTIYVDEIRNQGVAAHRVCPYGMAEENKIIERANAMDDDLYPCGVLKYAQYYKEHYSFIKAGKLWLQYSAYSSIIIEDERDIKSGWLDMELLEFYLRLMLPIKLQEFNIEESVQIMSLRSTQQLFFEPSAFKKLKTSTKEKFGDVKTRFLVMPVLNSNHYYVAIVDNKLKTFYYLNSQPTNERIVKTLNERFTKRTNREVSYKAVAVEVQIQRDTRSCGIHTAHNAIHAVISFSKGCLHIPNIEDTCQKREQMMDEMMRYADNIRNICPKCNNEAENTIVCRFCKRNLHQKCVTTPGFINQPGPPTSVICFECSHFLLTQV